MEPRVPCEAVSPCRQWFAVKMSEPLHNMSANALFTELMKFYLPRFISYLRVPIAGATGGRNTSFCWQRTQSRRIQPHTTSGKSVIVCLLGVPGQSVPLSMLWPWCLQNSTLHSVGAAQLLPLCPNGLLMTTTFCSTRRGHGEEERAGVFVCVFDFTFWNGGWVHKGDRGHPTHKTKIVMREGETRGGGRGGVDGFEEELSVMEEGSQGRRRRRRDGEGIVEK